VADGDDREKAAVAANAAVGDCAPVWRTIENGNGPVAPDRTEAENATVPTNSSDGPLRAVKVSADDDADRLVGSKADGAPNPKAEGGRSDAATSPAWPKTGDRGNGADSAKARVGLSPEDLPSASVRATAIDLLNGAVTVRPEEAPIGPVRARAMGGASNSVCAGFCDAPGPNPEDSRSANVMATTIDRLKSRVTVTL
jgi:hypothetical protein